jgi:hypothetical protein
MEARGRENRLRAIWSSVNRVGLCELGLASAEKTAMLGAA